MSEELKSALARIACLEGEIAKRDEELAACRIAVENCEVFRARIAELEARIVWLECEAQVNAAPVSEAKAQGVAPDRAAFEAWMLNFEHPVLGWLERESFTFGDDQSTYADEYVQGAWVACSRLNAAPVQQVSVPDEMRSLAQRLREYNQNPHHINPMSEAFHILVADAANAISTACVPKEIAAAITWSEHLLFECGALTSTRAPSVHVYNKTFAAVNEARAMLAAPAAPAADAWIQVSERLPESERTVLAFYNNSHGKSRRVRAEYIAHMSKGADDGWDGDADAYYDEATDESYWPAGWYEVIDNWDDLTHMVIHEGEVSHWMPLPAGPVAHCAKGVV